MNTNKGVSESIIESVTDFGLESGNKVARYVGIYDYKIYTIIDVYLKLILSLAEEISFILASLVDYTISAIATTISTSLKIGGTAATATGIGAPIGLPMNILGLFVQSFIYIGSFISFCLAFIFYYYIIRYLGIPYLYGLLGVIFFKILFISLLIISPYLMKIALFFLQKIKFLIAKILRGGQRGVSYLQSLVSLIVYIFIITIIFSVLFNIFHGIFYTDSNDDDNDNND